MTEITHTQSDNTVIRAMVRGVYDIQKLRIQCGNRVTGNFKAKLGMTPDGMSERELAAQEKGVLDALRIAYKRITDGVAVEGDKLPRYSKNFKGAGIIDSYAELVLVSQYMNLLKNEEFVFAQLKNILREYPIYTEFLEGVAGVGPAMAGVLISEIDITQAEYPSSLHKYAGLDVVKTASWTNQKGEEVKVPVEMLAAKYLPDGTALVDHYSTGSTVLIENRFPVTFGSEGRSMKKVSQVERAYTTRDGEEATRASITFNLFLKTKLMGVLATSFLRSGTSLVDGKRVGGVRRLEMAKAEGYEPTGSEEGEDDQDVCNFLRQRGHVVMVEPSHYGKVYYDYRARLDGMPRHVDKTAFHKHNMALRYMVKRFLTDYYNHARRLAGLVVAPEYSEAKLGLIHGQAKVA